MKTDKSIRNITIAAIKRSAMGIDTWNHSQIVEENDRYKLNEFELIENELPVFEIKSKEKHTLISTRRILEINKGVVKFIEIEFIDDVIYGNFKGKLNKPEISIFRIVDIYGEEMDFQMETGKAAMGLINSVNTLLKLAVNT